MKSLSHHKLGMDGNSMVNNYGRAKYYFILSILIQLIVLNYSSLNGNLAGLVPWDDCGYLIRGIRNLEKVLSAISLKDLLLIWPKLDIHAPVADLQTLVGMLLFQRTWIGVYLLNFLFVWIGLVTVDRFFSNYRPLIRIPIVIYFLLAPFVFVVFDQIKADHKGGLFFFCCLLLLFQKSDSRPEKKTRAVAIGIFGCLAILSKITTFYMPAILFLSALLGALVRLIGNGTIRLNRRGCSLKVLVADTRCVKHELTCFAVSIGLMFVPLLVVWYFWHEWFVWYINYALGNVWDSHLNLSEQLLYYTPWNAVNLWGSIFVVTLAVILSSIVISYRTKRWTDVARIGALLFIVAVTLIPLLVAKVVSVGYGAYFYFALLATSFCAIEVLLTSVKEHWRIVLATALFLVGAVQPLAIAGSGVSREEQRANYRAFSLIADEINEAKGNASTKTGREPYGIVLYECYLMPHPNLALVYYRNYAATLRLERFDDYEQKVQSLNDMLEWSDFVLSIDNDDAKGLVKSSPFIASAHAAELHEKMLKDSRFALRRSLPVMNFNVHLFVKQ